MIKGKPVVEKLLSARKKRSEIKNLDQARKSIAGNLFAQILVYIFLKNKKIGNIRRDIFITSRKPKLEILTGFFRLKWGKKHKNQITT